jgi:nucleotide-binding universal stress UspA family protein
MFTVVMGVDRDVGRALSCARTVDRLPGDAGEKSVVLLHSFTDNDGGASAMSVESVSRVRDYLEEHDIEYDVVASSEAPSTAIVETAEQRDADLIVLAGRKRSPAGKVLFGSVTQSVILETSRPVLVAEPEAVA